MKLAGLSGKGGTGKTLVSVNLAAVAEQAAYYDCDVEEPNGHLFFKQEQVTEKTVFVKTPEVDPDDCIGCRKCADFCKFNAILPCALAELYFSINCGESTVYVSNITL